ncbi:MAG: hypothetical protein HY962_00170 [Ignavibacteriae bacterium]|nr:hypothetical protein [Ignavibacteriota bacterium]
MRAGAIIQARCGSQRFARKVLQPLPSPRGRCSVEHIIARAGACTSIAQSVIATTTGREDDVLEEKFGPLVFRGDAADVLDRYAAANTRHTFDIVVRLTGDNPCIFPWMLDRLVTELRESGGDYARLTGIPLGLHAEAFTAAALKRAHADAKDPYEREHVTPYFYRHPELFDVRMVEVAVPRTLADVRLTLDYPSDYALLNIVFGFFADGPPSLEALDTLFQERPWLRDINRNHQKADLGAEEQMRAAIALLNERELTIPADILRHTHRQES